MKDLISRQDAVDAMEESKKTYFDRRVIIGKMQDIVNNLPPAQPEIIRCKDCRFYQPMIDQDDLCDYRQMQVFEDDYCSRAERRAEKEEVTA